MGHLVDVRNKTLFSFQGLQTKYDLPKHVFCGCLQERHYAQSLSTALQFPNLHSFEQTCLTGPSCKALIPTLYKTLIALPLETLFKHFYVKRWEQIPH